MILYLDTSALLKKYFKELFSEHIISAWKQAPAIVTSAVTYAETLASMYRKNREVSFDETVFENIVRSFQRDWKSFITVEVNDDLNRFVDYVVGSHPLRGFDAIHLASALTVNEPLPEGVVFACFDKVLLNAAKEEGLNTLPDRIEQLE